MDRTKDVRLDPKQEEQEISYDESVCSAEFSQGCTIPVSEQED